MAYLTPSPKMQFFTANGIPLVGGKLYTYEAGTTTPLATYVDQAGSSSNPNPIILDSRGEADVWLGNAVLYDFVLKDSLDTLIWTGTNVGNAGSNPLASTFKVQNFSGDGTTVAFVLTYEPPNENNTQVYINGAYQQKNTYTVGGTTLTFSSAPPLGTNNIEVMTIATLSFGYIDSSLVNYIPAGIGAVPTTVQARLQESISVLDFYANGVSGVRVDRTGVVDSTLGFQAAIIAANGGTIYVPDGTYSVSKLGTQGTWIVGQSRSNTIIKCNTNQAVTTYVLDQCLNRDGVTINTIGGGGAANLTVDCNNKTLVSGIRTYGGGVTAENCEIKNGVDGFIAGLPIWANFKNIYSHSHTGRGFFTYAGVADNGTSTTFENCWANACGTYGFHITQLIYSSFINCVSQGCTNYGWYAEGNANGLSACYSLQFIGCANEGGTVTPFYFKKQRDCTVIAPRVIAPAASINYMTLDDFTGTIENYSTTSAPTSGFYTLNPINNGAGEAVIYLLGGVVTYDSVVSPYLVILGSSIRRLTNSQSVNYTLTLADAGRMVIHPTGAGAGDTFTIPANSAVAYPVGTEIVFMNRDAAVSIAITTDTLVLANSISTGTRTLASNSMAVARKVEATLWIIGSEGGGLT